MDKITYLAQLAEGLARWVPERERQEILRYYAEYFQEAGEEREAEVIAELGDPWALSSRLAVEGGYVTQAGANAWTPRKARWNKRKIWPWVTAGTLTAVVLVAVFVGAAAMWMGRAVGRAVRDEVVIGGGDESTGITVVEDEQHGFVYAVPVPSENIAYVEDDFFGGFWSMEDGYLDPFLEIDVDASIANVTVTSGEDYTLFISSNATLGGYSLKWEVKDGVLKIRDDGSADHMNITSWDDFKNMFGIDASAMDVAITVPDGQLEKLKIKTGLGDVFLSQLYMEQKLEAETGLGDIECYEVEAWDEVDLETGLGDVTLGVSEAYSGAEYDLKTGMGTIEAQIDGLEKDWDYEAKTGMGTVTLNGDSRGTKLERKSKSDYTLEAETGMGDINLYFQDDRW